MKSLPSFVTHYGAIILILFCAGMIMSCSNDDATYETPLVISSASPLKGPKTSFVTITGSGFSANVAICCTSNYPELAEAKSAVGDVPFRSNSHRITSVKILS